jgi:hypothetical protein
MLPPNEQGDIVLGVRNAASFCGYHMQISEPMQLKEDLGAIGSRHDDRMRFCHPRDVD